MRKAILSFAVTGLLGALGFGSVASAEGFDWYGSIRAGAVYHDDDTATGGVWDLGATKFNGTQGGQGLWSRIGIKGSTELDNGMTAGLRIERAINGGDSLSGRLQNVWIGGDWGTLTFGQQNNPYRGVANWDQTWFLGGQVRTADGGSRVEGIGYSSNIDGPFSFNIMATGDNRSVTTGGAAILNDGSDVSDDGEIIAKVDDSDGVDRWIATASYDFGVLSLNVGYNSDTIEHQGGALADADTTGGNQPGAFPNGTTYDNTGISLNGSVAGLDWYVAYNQAEDNTKGGLKNDVDVLGVFLSYDINDNDKIYIQYEDSDSDLRVDSQGNPVPDPSATVIGYSHSFGGSTTFIAEYLSQDLDTKGAGDSPSVLNLVLKVDF